MTTDSMPNYLLFDLMADDKDHPDDIVVFAFQRSAWDALPIPDSIHLLIDYADTVVVKRPDIIGPRGATTLKNRRLDESAAQVQARVDPAPLQVPVAEWGWVGPAPRSREGHMTDFVEAASFNRREAMRLAIDTFGGPITSVQIGILADRAREILQFIEEP